MTKARTDSNYLHTRTQAMADALHQRLNPRAPNVGCSGDYRSMSLLEISREFLEIHGVETRGLGRMELASRVLTTRSSSMMGTGDFSALMANVATKRLSTAYMENPGTYDLWARRAPDAPDFKSINVVQISGAPSLLRTNEHGEFTYGTMLDKGETYSVLTYGRIISLSRQALVNDDLRAFDRMVLAFAVGARRLENRLVYSQLTDNSSLSDGKALFHSDHGNLGAGIETALALSSLSTGRAAMRKQKGLQNEELNIAPAYLIVPASLETTAYQLTSAQYTPATVAAINEFRSGGRTSLAPVVEPLLDASSATAWYLAANNSQVDTVEYCYLAGSDGPTIDVKPGFDTDGISMRCRLDFAAKAIDHRGLYKAAGQ